MMENKRKSLSLAVRRNRGSQILGGWIAALKEACGFEATPENFLTLEETEELKRKFFERVKSKNNCFHRYWPQEALRDIASLLKGLGPAAYSTTVALFSNVDKYIGAVSLPAGRVLSNPEAVWKVVDEDLSITTLDLQHGLCLEYNFYTDGGEYIREGFYELTAWGVFVPER
jgi:hypothetical protein